VARDAISEAKQDHATDNLRSFVLQVNQIKNLALPPEIKTKGPANFECSIQIVANLLLKQKFIGRTYIGNAIPVTEKLSLPFESSDFLVVNTKSSEDMSLVLELLFVTKEIIKIPKVKAKVAEESKKEGDKKEIAKEEFDKEKRDFKRYQFGFAVINLN
jgi:hypothetical protein